MAQPEQPSLFDAGLPALPAGFRYQPDILLPEEEEALIRQVQALPLREFEFQGFVGRRRIVSFGWRYDFNGRELQKADDIPAFLQPFRERAAAMAGLGAGSLQHVLVTEYASGAAIGWHRDKAVFGEVIGISLAAACQFRFRRRQGSGWERAAIALEPRSAYLLAGPARTEWEHSIPPVQQLRYSITFRNFIEERSGGNT